MIRRLLFILRARRDAKLARSRRDRERYMRLLRSTPPGPAQDAVKHELSRVLRHLRKHHE